MKIKPITKFLKLFLAKNVVGITLCPFGIYVSDNPSEKTINHEKIHWKQQVELLVIPFYIIYLLEFLIKFLFYGKDSYRNISFEREAYSNDENLDYLKSRKLFSWIKYIF